MLFVPLPDRQTYFKHEKVTRSWACVCWFVSGRHGDEQDECVSLAHRGRPVVSVPKSAFPRTQRKGTR